MIRIDILAIDSSKDKITARWVRETNDSSAHMGVLVMSEAELTLLRDLIGNNPHIEWTDRRPKETI